VFRALFTLLPRPFPNSASDTRLRCLLGPPGVPLYDVQDIKKRGITFDAVFVSHMRRARETCALVLEVAQPDYSGDIHIDHRCGEKSFGVFAGENINLLRSAYGSKVFERLTASGCEQPPAAEPLSEVFDRMQEFYTERVLPLTQAGKNVLVVSHQYALEPLALYLSGKGPDDYDGALDLPNGKAMSVADMAKFQAHHSAGLRKAVKRARDSALVNGMPYVAAAGLFGAILRLAIVRRMPTNCFTVLIVCSLAVSSFYTYLDVNVPASFANTPLKPLLFTLVSWLCRLGICIPIAGRVVTQQQFLWVLLCMVPPALTSSVSSVLWGGGKYLCVTGALLLYIAVPPVLAVLSYAPGYLYDNKAMTLFYTVLGAGLIFPAACAQAWRTVSPVDAAKHRKEWAFLSIYAVVALALLGVYQVTPGTRGASVLVQMFYPFNTTNGASPVAALECERAFFQGVVTYMAMKGIPGLMRKLWVYFFDGAPEQAMDWYILHTQPNIFLWLGLANSVTPPPNVTFVKFWAVLFFFLLPALENSAIVKDFMHMMLRKTTQSKHISIDEMETVWVILRKAGAVCVDDTGEEALDIAGVTAFVAYVQELTTGVVDEAPMHVTHTLFEELDTDNSGFVTKSELYTYVSSVGLVIDLNGHRSARRAQLLAADSRHLASSPSAATVRAAISRKITAASLVSAETLRVARSMLDDVLANNQSTVWRRASGKLSMSRKSMNLAGVDVNVNGADSAMKLRRVPTFRAQTRRLNPAGGSSGRQSNSPIVYDEV